MTTGREAFRCPVIIPAVTILFVAVAAFGGGNDPESVKLKGQEGRSHTSALVEKRRTISEKIVGQLDSSAIRESLASSPDLRRIAYVSRVGAKQFVVVDGKEGKHYDGIGKGILTQGQQAAYFGAPIFSPDSSRVAYAAREGGKWFVVVDGKEEKSYDDINALTLIFSPDSHRVAYVVGVGAKQSVVVGGKEEKPYDWIGDLLFSPDSRRVAYWAGVGGKRLVVVDDKEGKPYDGVAQGEGPYFLPDSSWVALTYRSVLFSPDSRRLAYSATLGPNGFAVVDGKEQKPYGNIYDGPIFSPDSRRVMYMAYSPGGGPNYKVVVVDGKEEKHYDGIGEGSLQFSPNSRRVAYCAKAGARWFAVVDGKEEKAYDDMISDLIFSPDSRRVAYAAGKGGKWFAVVDGKEEKAYDDMGSSPIFSPDSRRVAYWAKVGEKYLLVVDGEQGKPYDDLVRYTIVFDSASTFHYLAVKQTARGQDVYLVEETIE